VNAIARSFARPLMLLAGMAYFAILAYALVWLQLPPQVLLVLILGGVGVVVLILRPVVGVHVFLMMVYVETVSATSEGVTAMKVVGPFIILGWLFSLAIQRKSPIASKGFFVALILFVGWCGISATHAYDVDISLGRLYTFLQLAIAAIMVSSVVDDARKVRGVYGAIVTWTSISTIIALTQYYLGMSSVARGLVGDRNLLATHINIGIVCAYFLYQSSPRGLARLAVLMALPVLFWGLALTLSRAGLVVFMLALLAVWYRTAKERSFLVLVASAIVLCVITFALPDQFWTRAGTIVPAVERQEGTFGLRVKLWKVGLRMIEDRPFTGVGPSNFVVAFPHYARGEMITRHLVAHNSYVSVASEMGLVGLAFFLTLHLLALREARRAIHAWHGVELRDVRVLAVTAEICLFVIMGQAMTGSAEAFKLLWFFFGLCLSVGKVASQGPMHGARLTADAAVQRA